MHLSPATYGGLAALLATLCASTHGQSSTRRILSDAGSQGLIAPLVRAGHNGGATSEDGSKGGPLLVCYFQPTKYFLPSKVPPDVCTHIIYAFGDISTTGPTLADPTPFQKWAWATLTALRQKNPSLKVMLSLQKGFPGVVGPDEGKMKQFAANCVAYLRQYSLDGLDLDWEPYPPSSDKGPFALLFQLLRTAIAQDAQSSGLPALLLSLALPNNHVSAQQGFDIPTISSAVDFGTVMAYDFHVYSLKDNVTGYNSPLLTPPGDYKYLSSAAMTQFYLSQGMSPSKLLLGIPTYGRSWKLASAASHGYRAPAVGKGSPGPHRNLTGVYTYPDACIALQQGATSVYNVSFGGLYLYKDVAWVAYEDVTTVTQKSQWARQTGLGGVGVWSMTLDDIDGVCGAGPLPLLTALKKGLLGGAGTVGQDRLHDGSRPPPLALPRAEWTAQPGAGHPAGSDDTLRFVPWLDAGRLQRQAVPEYRVRNAE